MTKSFVPHLCCQWQLVEFGACLRPCRVMLGYYGNELIAVGWLDEMAHLMDHHVFDQILGFLNQFGVQPDVPGLVVATAPLGLHTL